MARLQNIFNEGYWDVIGAPYAMPGQPKRKRRSDYSPFVKKADVKKVRAGLMPIQKAGNIEAKKATFPEDQYKHPTGKHRRSQSMYPSSFQRSKTFGGISDDMTGKPKVRVPNLKPIGLFGPVDKNAPQSHARAGPPPGTNAGPSYGERSKGSGNMPVRRGGGGTRAESLEDRLEHTLMESYAEDDVYTIVQRIGIDSGMVSKPIKFEVPPKRGHFAKICNGRIRVEARPWRRYIIIEVFKNDKRIYNSEIDVRIGGYLRNEQEIKSIIDTVKSAMER